MRIKFSLVVVGATSVLVGAACFSGSDTATTADTAPATDTVSDTSTTADTAPGSDVATADAGPTGAHPAAESLPNGCVDSSTCGKATCRENICADDPPEGTAATITDPQGNLATTTEPDLSCVGQPPASPAGPSTVTLYGAVARFGSGLKTQDLEVDVFRADGYDPSVCEAEPNEDAILACYDAYGKGTALYVGGTTSVLVGDVTLPENCNQDGHAVCPLGYRCVEGDLDHDCLEQYGLYEVSGVPTNTKLVIRTRVPVEASDGIKRKWHTSYAWNVYLFADKVAAGDRYHYDATIVSHGQWLTTPNTVGLPETPPENGVIGGRVRDCRKAGERPGWSIDDVRLSLGRKASHIVYFNELEDEPVTIKDRVVTNLLGRFAAMDIEPGWNVVTGTARVGGQLVSLGQHWVYVFPNSLSVLSMPGIDPHYVQN